MIKLYFLLDENANAFSKAFTAAVLCKYLEVNARSLTFCANEFGKPSLTDYPKVHYNVSHTKGAIICAVSDKPVGIDVENPGRFNKRIAEKFFTRHEQDYVFAGNEEQDIRFTEVWTRKEAYVKWTGKGMRIPFSSFDVLNVDGNYIWMHTEKLKGYILSVCVSANANTALELIPIALAL